MSHPCEDLNCCKDCGSYDCGRTCNKGYESQSGFVWGNTEIRRLFLTDKGRALSVKTPRREMTIHITPSGLIRTFEYKLGTAGKKPRKGKTK